MEGKKQTAVEWLFEQWDNWDLSIKELFEKAKQMEREQIMDAYNSGQQIPPFEYAEQYYNETYGKDKSED
jgi:hypothetical protein